MSILSDLGNSKEYKTLHISFFWQDIPKHTAVSLRNLRTNEVILTISTFSIYKQQTLLCKSNKYSWENLLKFNVEKKINLTLNVIVCLIRVQ